MTDGSATRANLEGRRICVIYDCLFPLTHGGAERWYRCLADELVASGGDVIYLTRRQWTGSAPPWPGVTVTAVSASSELYDDHGVRRTGPTLAFGAGTFVWLIRHRHKIDAVIVASFPFFSFLAARVALVVPKLRSSLTITKSGRANTGGTTPDPRLARSALSSRHCASDLLVSRKCSHLRARRLCAPRVSTATLRFSRGCYRFVQKSVRPLRSLLRLPPSSLWVDT